MRTLSYSLLALVVSGCLAPSYVVDDSATAGASGGGGLAGGGSEAGQGGLAGKANTAGSGNAAGNGEGGIVIPGAGSGGGPSGDSSCPSVPDDDHDNDGWTEAQGDCNDCDANVNPGAIDIVNYSKNADGTQGDPLAANKQIDEDCDGKAAQPGESLACDASLGVSVKDPFDAARAMGLCSVKVDEASRKWGVISAVFSDIAGAPLNGAIKATGEDLDLSFGILPDFGTTSKPREGDRIFSLSSGEARAPGQPGYNPGKVCSFGKDYSSGYPNGFPKEGTCGTSGEPNDGVALDLKIRVPTNAKTLKFSFRFFSCDYPQSTCSIYNDAFAVLMAPSPLDAGDPMTDSTNSSANIAFETTASGAKNVIGLNNEGLFVACEPGAVSGNYANCKPGNGAQLAGSGFEGHGASAWLTTQAAVPPGGIIFLRFAIWDSSDGLLDSTAIVDNFQWSTEEGTGVVTQIDNGKEN